MLPTITEPTEEEVADLAKSFWEEEGQPEGKAEEHWNRARERLRDDPGQGSNRNAEVEEEPVG